VIRTNNESTRDPYKKSLPLEPEGLEQVTRHEMDCAPDDDDEPVVVWNWLAGPTAIETSTASIITHKASQKLVSARLVGSMREAHERFAKWDDMLSDWKEAKARGSVDIWRTIELTFRVSNRNSDSEDQTNDGPTETRGTHGSRADQE
jgi:hypothetical protein